MRTKVDGSCAGTKAASFFAGVPYHHREAELAPTVGLGHGEVWRQCQACFRNGKMVLNRQQCDQLVRIAIQLHRVMRENLQYSMIAVFQTLLCLILRNSLGAFGWETGGVLDFSA